MIPELKSLGFTLETEDRYCEVYRSLGHPFDVRVILSKKRVQVQVGAYLEYSIDDSDQKTRVQEICRGLDKFLELVWDVVNKDRLEREAIREGEV